MTSREEFIENYTTNRYQKFNKDVVTFIADILYDGRNKDGSIRSFFRAGYCYYFAAMLKDAFGRGTLCVAEPYGHIVWMDEDGCAYDIEGPYLPADHECEGFTNVVFYGDAIYDFMHVPGKEYHGSPSFHEWAKFMKMTDIYAATLIYGDIPKEKVDWSTNFQDNVELYWMQHQMELQEKYWKLRNISEEWAL